MKTLAICLFIALFVSLGFLTLAWMENSKYREVQQKEIDHLKKQNLAQKDSLEKELTLTRDSLHIAFETIKLANKERIEAHERSQKTIRDLQKIVFIQHTDSSRNIELNKLYPTFKPL